VPWRLIPALGLVLLAASLPACQEEERRERERTVDLNDEPTVHGSTDSLPEVTLEAAAIPEGPARVAGSELPTDATVEHLRTAPAVRFRPSGRGELLFALELDAPVDALWIPETDADPDGWAHELAAWRVARCIGLDQVSPAARRDVTPGELRARLDPEFADLWDELEQRIRWGPHGAARGTAVLMVREARPSGLSRGRRLERWSRYLRQGVSPDEDRRRVHADLADLVLFDYLVAHPDRLDDGVLALPRLERLVLRDHRDAFAPEAEAAAREQMLNVEKLTEAWAEGLLTCDDRALSASLRDGEGGHLLSPEELVGLLDRRRTLVSHAAALVDAHGRDEVVVLP